jgi:ADP-ribose pyrophosphatase YjhB (NUDIX family)
MTEKWLEWARKLQSLAQSGLAYSQNTFDRERYEALNRVAAEIVAESSGLPADQVQAIFGAQNGPAQYPTPKVDVRAAAFQDGQVLLVQEMLDGGRWTLPGGWMDMGDTPGGAAAREFREETGYEVRVTKLAAVYDRDRHGHPAYYFSILKMFFVCELSGGEARTSSETGASAFFLVDQLPELSIPRVTAEEIQMLYQHHLQPELPTEFDY